MENTFENGLRTLPLLPLKNSVLFPGLMMPLSVGREASLGAVEKALATEDKEIVIVAQRDPSVDRRSTFSSWELSAWCW
jgi:ATP-dependent Lon protease